MKKKTRAPVLEEVFRKIGNASQLAEILGVTRAAVSFWKVVPFRHLKTIHKLTGISRKRLRPDLYE
jgi:DNA-binding transcriptional regulator YdaS (Cro superfamily)